MADQFGRVLLIGREGSVVTLDLYEESHIVGRGFHLETPPSELSILHEVEVAIDREFLEAVESETQLAEFPLPLDDHLVEYPGRPPMRITAYRPDPSRKIVVGSISVLDDVLTFQVEEFGSPEPITLIIVGVWALVCVGGNVHDAIKTCEKKALEVCGRGGVLWVKSKRSLWKLGCSASCEYQCIDGQPAREDLKGTLQPSGAPA
jgi:hypothetical protein